MKFHFKHNLITISLLALIPIYFSCAGSAINVKENKKIADELISQAFIHSDILDENNKIKYSFSGWHTFGKNDIIKSINIILEQRRKDKLRRKIRGLLRSTYLLIKAHNASIEKLLHPDSQFVNNILKPEFEKNAN